MKELDSLFRVVKGAGNRATEKPKGAAGFCVAGSITGVAAIRREVKRLAAVAAASFTRAADRQRLVVPSLLVPFLDMKAEASDRAASRSIPTPADR